MKFDNSFFEDEVRLGFYIPAMVKHAWAAEMEVLSKIDELCKKYNISYFADWGTLLATVRHGGFIPWDDDLDIVMRRRDYERFRKAAHELPEGYAVYNYKDHDDYWLYICRVVGKQRICFEQDHLEEFHDFPYIAGVDIFVLDNVSSDIEDERERDKLARFIIVTGDNIAEGNITGQQAIEELTRIDKVTGTSFVALYKANRDNLSILRRSMYAYAEELFGKFDDNECDMLTQLFPFGMQNENFRFSKKWYEKSVRLPYENITMPLPLSYDAVLHKRYGDYLRLVKNAGAHGYPFYEAQNESLLSVLDFEFPEYKFKREDAIRDDNNIAQLTYKKYISQNISDLKKLYEENFDAGKAGDMQEIAVCIGNAAEEYIPEKVGSLKIVSALEELCELVFELHESFLENSNEKASDTRISICMEKIEQYAREEIYNRREAVFICFKAEAFKYYEKEYERLIDEGYDVKVIPVPYHYKRYDGSVKGKKFEWDNYPGKLKLTEYAGYDIKLHHPDIIYIQNPYDEWNTSYTLDTDYYASKLKYNTDKLVYIPWFKTEDFTSNEERQYANMKHYCLMPGVVFSDIVYVQSDIIRDTYINKLVEWAGEDTREIWQRKIVEASHIFEEDNKEARSRKKILFHVEISSFEQCETAFKKIEKCIDLFSQSSSIDVVWYQEDEFEQNLKDILPNHYARYLELVDSIKPVDNIEKCNGSMQKVARECDAYYGDACLIPIFMQNEHKPVMIMNYDID